MRSQPANAATSASRVERGRWKFVSSASTTRKRWPGRMKSAAAPGPARTVPSAQADSSARTVVVPTATTRPPRARATPIASTVAGGMSLGSGAITWWARSSVRMGRKVPGPTCSVRLATRTPAAAMAASSSALRWSPAVGRRRGASDVGRQRHLAHSFEPGERRLVEREAEAPAAVAERGDPLAPAAREVDALAGARRAAHEHLPLAVLPEWCDEEELEAPAARPPPGHPSRDDTRVVHDEHVPGAQEAREVADVRVAERCAAAVEHQEARRRALGRGRLRDQRLGQRVVELREPHQESVRVAVVSEANEPGSESGKRSDDRRGVPEGTPQEGGASTPLAAPGSFAAATMATRTAS